MKKSLFITTLTALSVSSFASEPTAVDFASLDLDSDGQISQQEALVDKGVSARFNELDIDQNGLLSSDEFSAVTSETEMTEVSMVVGDAMLFSTLDVDGNAVISLDEAGIDTDLLDAFTALDTDNNQELSEEEYSQFNAQ